MSLIKDVNREVSKLDLSQQNLRKFGLVVGGVFLLIASFLFYKDAAAIFRFLCATAGTLLVVASLLFPAGLKNVYSVWMQAALVIGWVVSRLLLTFIFFLVLTPIGLIAKLFSKDFLNISKKTTAESYWIKRDRNRKPNYEKMH